MKIDGYIGCQPQFVVSYLDELAARVTLAINCLPQIHPGYSTGPARPEYLGNLFSSLRARMHGKERDESLCRKGKPTRIPGIAYAKLP